jgi:hypothetical protein
MSRLLLLFFLAIALQFLSIPPSHAANYTLSIGVNGSGVLDATVNRSDRWAITVPEDGSLTITVTQELAGDLLDMDFFDTDGVSELARSRSNGSVESVTVANLRPGTYYLVPFYYSGSVVNYNISATFTANSLPNDTEPNDTVAQAQTIPLNGSVTGHIGYTSGGTFDASDYFKITIPADGRLVLTVTQDRDGDVVDVFFYDINGTTEITRGATGGKIETIDAPNLAPGTYYLLVRRYSSFCGYTVQSSFTPLAQPNDTEPNDTAAQAQNIPLNGSVTGHIGYASGGTLDAADYFKITIPADGRLFLTVTQDRDGDVVDVNFYDINGTTEITRSRSTSKIETIDVPNLTPGTYYLLVYRYSNFCGYTVQSGFTPHALPNDTEPNDTQQTARAIPQDLPATGHLGFYGNSATDRTDWFRFVLPADGNFWLDIVSDATLETDMELYNATGAEIARDHANGTVSRLGVNDLKAGVYYLRMYDFSGYGGYTITPVYGPYYVNLLGLRQIIPGEDVSYVVRYANPLSTPLDNVVVMVDLPLNIDIRGATGGGIYRADNACRNQVFWKLGTLAASAGGEVTVTFSVPWGTPYADMKLSGSMGASNMVSPPFDVAPYLNYVPNRVASEQNLTANDVSALLAERPELSTLYNLVSSQGYHYFGTAVRYTRQDASEVVRLYLLAPGDAAPTILSSSGGTAFAEVFRGDTYIVFDALGGFSWNSVDQTFVPWGAWANASSAPSPKLPAKTLALTGLREAQCQFNCTLNSIPDVVAKKVSSIYKNLKFSQNCIKCAMSIEAGTPDAETCSKCTASGAGKVSKDIAANVPLLGDAVSWSWTVKKCFDDCQNDPSKHICTEEKKECDWSVIGWMGGFDTVLTTPCNKTTGTYGIASYRTYCAYGDSCTNGACGAKPACPGNTCQQKTLNVRASHDPNAKSVDFKGDVLPGQRLNYTLEYENTGGGSALGVFLLDKLDTNLDEASLTINDGGNYSASTRVLEWNIGDLPAAGKGSVSFGVNVKPTATGTKIVNQANVYFPSALEVTPTNAVVNTLAALTADPKSASGISYTAIPVTLSGHRAGGETISYRITSYPAHGSLTGTAPALTYTSAQKFSGQDEFYYTAVIGSEESAPAKVTVTVTPNAADSTPPTVSSTIPASGATGVHVNANPVSLSPLQYLPAIKAVFSEAMDSSTITAASFSIDGIAGTTYYDPSSFTATFQPAVALATSTTYTARLATLITNQQGTALVSPYSWQFTTENPAHISVGLPLGVSELIYPGTHVSQVSESKTITIISAGSQPLTLGAINIAGANSTDFSISGDACSGKTVPSGDSCSFAVSFAPTVAGNRVAQVSIPSNDISTPDLTVPLKGTATFPCALTITTAGNGSGTLSGAGTYSCGQTIAAIATPNTGSAFSGWGGDCSGITSTLSVLLNQNKTCTATFTLLPLKTLTLSFSGSGGGVINSDPSGFTCTYGACSKTYYLGTELKLNATPDKDSHFSGWGGDCIGNGACSLNFSDNRDVSATFLFVNPAQLVVSGTPAGTYTSLENAFAAAPLSGGVIKTRIYTFNEALAISGNKSVKIQGGFETDFISQSGFSLLNGGLVINNGALVVERLVIH